MTPPEHHDVSGVFHHGEAFFVPMGSYLGVIFASYQQQGTLGSDYRQTAYATANVGRPVCATDSLGLVADRLFATEERVNGASTCWSAECFLLLSPVSRAARSQIRRISFSGSCSDILSVLHADTGTLVNAITFTECGFKSETRFPERFAIMGHDRMDCWPAWSFLNL